VDSYRKFHGLRGEDRIISPFGYMGAILPVGGSADRVRVHPTITKVLLDFRNVPKGTFPFHCHMLFHADHGMIGIIRVE